MNDQHHAARAAEPNGPDPAPTAGSWTPAFPGQRRPFETGNSRALIHGSRNERTVGPRAAALERAARSDPQWPPYLSDSTYRSAVTAWARAEAVAELLWEYLAEQDIGAAMTALETAEENTTGPGKGPGRKVSTTRRTASALDAWHRAMSTAAGLRKSLGLDPLSRARLGKDVTAAAAMRTAGLDVVRAQGRAALAGRSDHSTGTQADAPRSLDAPEAPDA